MDQNLNTKLERRYSDFKAQNLACLFGYVGSSVFAALCVLLNIDTFGYDFVFAYAAFTVGLHLFLAALVKPHHLISFKNSQIIIFVMLIIWGLSFGFACFYVELVRPALLIGAFLMVNFAISGTNILAPFICTLLACVLYLLKPTWAIIGGVSVAEFYRDFLYSGIFLMCGFHESSLSIHFSRLRGKLVASRQEAVALNQQIKEQVLVRYLPTEMVEDIFAGKIEMDHEPHAQTITVLFSDLSGFTKLGEQLSPKDYAAQLNEYLSFMNEIIFGNLGTVDKFMGDAIMVMFGAPKQMPPFQQAQRAITCARAMQNGLEALNEKWAERGMPALSQRIGIHQGTAVVGNFGSERRSDYTCIGSAVNLASRIETACEVGKVYVSQSIHQLLPDETEEVGQFELKSIEGKTSLYQVVSDNS